MSGKVERKYQLTVFESGDREDREDRIAGLSLEEAFRLWMLLMASSRCLAVSFCRDLEPRIYHWRFKGQRLLDATLWPSFDPVLLYFEYEWFSQPLPRATFAAVSRSS